MMGQPVPWQTVNDPASNLNSASPGPMKLQQFKFFKEGVLGSAFYCSFYNSVYNLYDIIKWKTQKTGDNGDFHAGFQGEAVRKVDVQIQPFLYLAIFCR